MLETPKTQQATTGPISVNVTALKIAVVTDEEYSVQCATNSEAGNGQSARNRKNRVVGRNHGWGRLHHGSKNLAEGKVQVHLPHFGGEHGPTFNHGVQKNFSISWCGTATLRSGQRNGLIKKAKNVSAAHHDSSWHHKRPNGFAAAPYLQEAKSKGIAQGFCYMGDHGQGAATQSFQDVERENSCGAVRDYTREAHLESRYSPNCHESDRSDRNVRSPAEKQVSRAAKPEVTTQTGNGSKNLTGLAAAVSTTPGSGTYGSIDRGTWTFWRNINFDATTDGGAAATSANIQDYMHRVALQLVRGRDKPDLIVADNNYYRLYLESLTAIQRVSSMGDDGNVGSGFTSLKYYGVGFNSDVILGGGIGAHETSNRMFFLNTKYLHWRPHADRNMVPIGGERMAVNQDAIVKLIGWAGNLTCSGARYQGLLSD